MGILVLWCLVAPVSSLAAEKSPHEIYDGLNALRVDSSAAYPISPANRIELRRGDAVISFEEGALAFLLPIDGVVTGAVFSGRGHVLAAPREAVEKQQMGRFLGAPVLDQVFVNAYLRFTDDAAEELLDQLRAAEITPQPGLAIASQWDVTLGQLNPLHSLRLLLDLLSPSHKASFYAGLDGASTGPFDVILDPGREEPFLIGQYKKIGDKTYYDIWTSHTIPSLPPRVADFRALSYSLDTSILPNNSLDGSALVRLRAETGIERVLSFQLSRALAVDRVIGDHGKPLEFFQNEGMSLQERSARGNDYLYVILPDVPALHQEFALRFHYRGNVIEDAGNGVLFVGARESWYPHLGDASDFASYDLTMRWPRKLRLAATGAKIDEREDGESRVGHWKAENAISVAGFNLGDYASSSVASVGRSIEVFANRQLEEDLKNRLASSRSEVISVPLAPLGAVPNATVAPPLPNPSPADALKQLGKEIDASIRFYETFSGPFPIHSLSVSQIPGTFGQGWPSLLYVSTYSFLNAEAQQRAGLNATTQEHFTELVPYHEVAHQWWGNVVAWSSYRDQWIDEAIANYLALLFADTKKNPDHTLHVWLARYRRQLVEKTSEGQEPAGEIGALSLGVRLSSSKSPGAYEQVVYSKGSWIMHMLREMLRQPGAKNPDARFTALLQKLVTKYAYRALSTDDLRREVEAVMTPSMDLEGGRSMEWFFEEWVRGTGVPHYRVEYTSRHTENGYAIRGKIFQTGVPRSFIASIPLYASGAAGRVFLGNVVAAGPETSFRFTTANPPRKIIIDPQMTLLCTTD
ncbi:MAG TPA: M1 family aminopeptidase [Methylomirabilota bacterium]|nr:M1 family aminopeptidase [Methylomirabilota bacterium]